MMPNFSEAFQRLFVARGDTRSARRPPRALSGASGRLDRGEPEAPNIKASKVGPLIAYENMGAPVWSPRDYGAFAREGFMQNAIVYRSVRMVAEAAASIPLILYEGGIEVEQHPLLDLMRRPSLDHTGTDFLEAWYGFLLVAGNAYVEAVSVDGEIRELHNLRPDRMKVLPGQDGWPAGYEYTAGGQSVRFIDEAVPGVRPILHTRLFHPANDHYGMSPIEAAAVAIDIHNTASGWNKALLDNSARPSGALVYSASNGQMTQEQFARLKTELETSFQGAAHAGRPLLLEGGLDWKPLSMTPKDMDFIEAKNSAAREIALAIGVPPILLGIPGDATYSNYAEAQRAFWRTTVLPIVNRMAQAMSMWLAPHFAPSDSRSSSRPEGAWLELKPDLDQVEALAPEREALWTRLESASFLTDDEKRAAAGYGPKESTSSAPGDSPTSSRWPSATTAKFNPNHDDAGRFTTADGVGGGSGNNVLVGGAGNDTPTGRDGRTGYPVSILEEDQLGGHTYERHVGKSEEYLKARITASRINVPLIGTIGEKRAGSFTSLEAANKLVNSVMAEPQNQVKLKGFVDKQIGYYFPVLDLYPAVPFGSPTGYEAYVRNDRAQPIMRATNSVLVRVSRTAKVPRGYFVNTAYPLNED